MAHVKDLWTRAVKQADGTTTRARNERWGRGKQWLAGWVDPEGWERTKAFNTKGPAERHANALERIASVGSPSIRKLGRFGSRWLRSGGRLRAWVADLHARFGPHAARTAYDVRWPACYHSI